MDKTNRFKEEGNFKPYKKPEMQTFKEEGNFKPYKKPEMQKYQKPKLENKEWDSKTFSWKEK